MNPTILSWNLRKDPNFKSTQFTTYDMSLRPMTMSYNIFHIECVLSDFKLFVVVNFKCPNEK